MKERRSKGDVGAASPIPPRAPLYAQDEILPETPVAKNTGKHASEDAHSTNRVFAVVRILDIPYHVDRPFTYYLTPDIAAEAQVGSFVLVPFGVRNRHVMGIITD